MQKTYHVLKGDAAPFINHVDECVGTGRVGLGLMEEYREQLALVQREIGFRYLRGHGLFHRDLAILNPYEDENGQTRYEYNFTYLDRLYDSYQALHIKPFLELGFMPKPIASGEQCIFWWEGNVTPPADYDAWADLVRATIRHLRARYGDDEVATWPVEVWNEPNLAGFWKDADFQEYLKLYDVTAAAVKEAFPRMRVGGPAVCGTEDHQQWIRDFLAHCEKSGAPVDFITRHIYIADTPDHRGRYLYHPMRDVSVAMDEMAESRRIIDSFPAYQGAELHVTEFNTSYNPRCPIHDTCLNAALTAQMLASFGDTAASYSYWTFGDVFEETGVPFTPFHGGFGLVADGCIPKPTFWTFAFFKALTGDCVLRTEELVVTREADGSYHGVCWNIGTEPLAIDLTLPFEGRGALVVKRVDEDAANPVRLWHHLGQPANPTREQMQLLRDAAHPQIESRIVKAEKEAVLSLRLNAHAVQQFTLTPVNEENDRGYCYDYYGVD